MNHDELVADVSRTSAITQSLIDWQKAQNGTLRTIQKDVKEVRAELNASQDAIKSTLIKGLFSVAASAIFLTITMTATVVLHYN